MGQMSLDGASCLYVASLILWLHPSWVQTAPMDTAERWSDPIHKGIRLRCPSLLLFVRLSISTG